MTGALVATSLAFGTYFSASIIDLSPNDPLPLGGYTQRSDKVMEAGGQPLFARVRVLQQEGIRIALVSAEMLTIPESLAEAVRAKIPKDVHLFLTATHTHCAPDSQMLNDRMTFKVPGIASFKQRWLEEYSGRIAEAVRQALEGPKSWLSVVATREVRLPLNRGRRPGASPDTLATFVELYGSGKHIGYVYHYTAHPVFFGHEYNRTSGDWPGALAQALEAPVLVGAIGDVSPSASGGSPEERIQNFTAASQEALKYPSPTLDEGPEPKLGWAEAPIELPEPTPHPEFSTAYGVPDALSQMVVKRFAPPHAQVIGFRLGKIAIVGIPGEPTSELGSEIRNWGRRIGFRSVLVVSHAGGWMGYILAPEDYDRGGYEATLAFHGREIGPRVVEAAKLALEKLAFPERYRMSQMRYASM